MQQPWQIHLFGTLRARQGECVVERFRTQKTRSLFGFLVLFPQQKHAREVLMELLWPDCEPSAARHSLRTALSSLRHQFEPSGSAAGAVFRCDRSSIGCDARAISTDVGEFEAALRAAQEQPENAETKWRAALDLYRAPLLEGLYDDWIMPQRRRLEEMFFGALHELTARLEEREEWEAGLEIAWRGARLDPLHEPTQRALMRLYAASGQTRRALQTFRELSDRLSQHKQQPDARTLALFQSLGAAAPRCRSISSSPKSAGSSPRNTPPSAFAPPRTGALWPVALTRFFGREDEIARLGEWLGSSDARLITLLGPGGSGKTRLGVEAVARQTDRAARWPGGVWFVALADLRDATLLGAALLEATGVRAAPGQEPLEALGQALATRPALLFLDSFEPLVEEGAARIEQLLRLAPGLTCLVSSRRRLRIAGERLFPVAPLPVPTEAATWEEVAALDSVRLFCDRAREVRPDFALTPAGAPMLARLCARLEGLPLALELCAARAGVLSLQQMLALLDHRFELLVSRTRGLAPRHRTLQGAIGWSFDLLAPEQQRFFARLSVFRGGFSCEAACVVGEEPDALDALEQLREWSLVETQERDGEVRFGLLDSLREFGALRLDANERAATGRRHAEFFLAPDFANPGHERDNVRAALEWSLSEDGPALRALSALVPWWEKRGQIGEARRWLERALESAMEPRQRAFVLGDLGRMALLQGDANADRLLEEALKLLRAFEDGPAMASTLTSLGVCALNRGEFARASAAGQASLELWHEHPPSSDLERRGLAETLSLLGTLEAAQCAFEAAIPLLVEAVEAFRALDEPCGLAHALDLLGQSQHRLGGEDALAGAMVLLDESLALFRGADERLWICRALWGRGHLALAVGDLDGAGSLYCEALEVAHAGRNHLALPYLLEALGSLALVSERAQHAARLLGAATALREGTGMLPVPFWTADSRRVELQTREALGEAAFAREWARGQSWSWDEAVAQAHQAT